MLGMVVHAAACPYNPSTGKAAARVCVGLTGLPVQSNWGAQNNETTSQRGWAAFLSPLAYTHACACLKMHLLKGSLKK